MEWRREKEAKRRLDLDQLPLRLLSWSRMLYILLDFPSPQDVSPHGKRTDDLVDGSGKGSIREL